MSTDVGSESLWKGAQPLCLPTLGRNLGGRVPSAFDYRRCVGISVEAGWWQPLGGKHAKL